MQKKPKVNVFLTSYNHAKFLQESIDSVLHQTYPDFRLVIVDDGSTDKSWAIINSCSDPRIQAFRNIINTHTDFSKAWSNVSGDYIAIHHSDDIWEPQKLEKQVSFLDNHPEIGAVFTNAMIIGEQGAPIEDKTHFYYNIFSQPNRSRYEWLNFFFYQGNALCHPSILIRKICYENCGLYRSGLAQIPDFDMWIRLCLKYEIHVLPERLVRFRVRANERNASGNRPETRIRGQFEFLQVLENYRRIITSEEFLKVFPNANRYFRQEGFDIGFALGKIALEPSTSNITKFFGLQLLFEALNDPDRARKIYALYGFSPKDFIALTAEHDVFSIEIGAQVAEKDQQVQALTAQVADIINSKSWKIELFFRRIRLLIVPPNSRRARLLWLLIKVFPPFIKNRRNRELEEDLALIRSSDLFNEDWYLSRYPDIAQAKADPLLHYLRHGGFEGRDPSANFSSKGYFETHRDVRAAGINPLVHYLRHGKSEGRLPESQ